MGAAAPVAALALGRAPLEAIAAAPAGAALAAAVRALAGDSAAALTAAVLAPLLAVAMLAERGAGLGAPCLALACMAWTCAELARPVTAREGMVRPLLALLPAAASAVLAPAAAALLAIAGARLARGPGPRPRWVLAAPLAGALVAALAAAAWLAPLGGLAHRWFGTHAHPISPSHLAALAGAALGPITAVAALGGLVALARPRARLGHGRSAELAVAACIAGALLSDLRAGAVGPLTLGLAALSAGLAAARFAGQIRPASGQALAGATAGLLLLLPPAWTVRAAAEEPARETAREIDRGAPAAPRSANASR